MTGVIVNLFPAILNLHNYRVTHKLFFSLITEHIPLNKAHQQEAFCMKALQNANDLNCRRANAARRSPSRKSNANCNTVLRGVFTINFIAVRLAALE
jgi:hypothetical protein